MTEQQLIDEGFADGKKSFELQWAKIESDFKWDNVYKAMKALDWTWSMGGNMMGIPSIATIKQNVRQYLFEVWNNEKGSVTTGGFTAGYDEGELYLQFTLEESHTGDL